MGSKPWIFVNWWLITLKKSKCPQLAKKAADIYERVHMDDPKCNFHLNLNLSVS